MSQQAAVGVTKRILKQRQFPPHYLGGYAR